MGTFNDAEGMPSFYLAKAGNVGFLSYAMLWLSGSASLFVGGDIPDLDLWAGNGGSDNALLLPVLLSPSVNPVADSVTYGTPQMPGLKVPDNPRLAIMIHFVECENGSLLCRIAFTP
uniref:Plastocyanin-like domain-containing protein n=1 Tax=Ascaris lumbricoides TaxID=6252 RepID=A0A0M3HTG0_ASCLU